VKALGGSELENPRLAGVEACPVALLTRKCSPGGGRGALDLLHVAVEEPSAAEWRHVAGPGPRVAVVQEDDDVLRRQHSEPIVEFVVADVELGAARDHVGGSQGLVEAVVLVAVLVPHLGSVTRVPDDDVVAGSGVLDQPPRDALLDGRLRRLAVDHHAPVPLGDAGAHDQDVTVPPGVVLGAGQVASLGVLEVDVVADPDDEGPVGGRDSLSGPEGQEGHHGGEDEEARQGLSGGDLAHVSLSISSL